MGKEKTALFRASSQHGRVVSIPTERMLYIYVMWKHPGFGAAQK